LFIGINGKMDGCNLYFSLSNLVYSLYFDGGKIVRGKMLDLWGEVVDELLSRG
jgi:Zn-dependent protease